MIRRLLYAGTVALVSAAVVACGSNALSDRPNPAAPTVDNGSGANGTGSLTVFLKDSPYTDAKAVLVTISEVSVHTSGGAWTTLPLAGGGTSITCDLKKLTSVQDVLGTSALAAGHYTQIRLAVSAAALYFDAAATGTPCAATVTPPTGKSAALDIPSDTIKINREFDVAAGATTTILLDFDGDKSINQIGNGTYKMSPVISVVRVQ